jgi:outer membrane immunogenic protein
MKKVLLGGVALITLGLAGSAFAADMPVKAPPVAPTNTWTGFYIGVDFGGIYGMHNTQSVTETGNYQNPGCGQGCFDSVTFNNPSNWGETGGVHLGYNYQLSPSWVVGGEVDWNKTALGNSPGQLFLTTGGGPLPSCINFAPGYGSCHGLLMAENLNWTTSARGKFGFIFGSAMFYATGGGALASQEMSGQVAAADFNTFSISTASNHMSSGWVAGGGVEVMATANVLIRIEYLRYAFNSGMTTVVPCTTCVPGFLAGNGNFTWTNSTFDVLRGAISYKF